MPRKVRDTALETRTARSRLKVRGKPYYRLIEPGLHLGYRKLPSGPGTWIARRYNGNGKYIVENLRAADTRIVLADDYADADGEHVLNFAQAQQKARRARSTRSGPATVSEILDNYVAELEAKGRSQRAIADTHGRINKLIRPKLGNITLGALTTETLRNWLRDIAHAPHARDGDARRARRATANRVWALLRAALNIAFRDGKIDNDTVWRGRVKPFEKVEAARPGHLSVEEAKRFINACDANFRPLAQAALQTGCRYGELTRLKVRDFDPAAGTLAVWQSKSGHARQVILGAEGVALLRQLTAGRSRDELLLHNNGNPWGRSHQKKPMADAVRRAKIAHDISFHGLRHTWASLAVMGGMPLQVVARNLGHTTVRMVEKFYGHLSDDYLKKAVRDHAPRFGFEPDKKIAVLGG